MNGNFNKKEFGDYQTPLHFSDTICRYIKNNIISNPDYIIEPNCGIGNFLKSAGKYFPRSIMYGIEINHDYASYASKILPKHSKIFINDFFEFNFENLLNEISINKSVLIIGNPPWVNNSTLSTINGKNVPYKDNIKNLNGFDAITGSSNFDISESIILKIVKLFYTRKANICFICKRTVARNIIKEMLRTNIHFNHAKLLNFDSKRIFNISADACVFHVALNNEKESEDFCGIYNLSEPTVEISKFGMWNGNFYSDLHNNPYIFDGKSCFEWRQGIKHDCSKIMELTWDTNNYTNGLNEIVDIEDTLVYPLIKSSDLKSYIITHTNKSVIVTQNKLKEDTLPIESHANKTWKYLQSHIKSFNSRKSSIYKNSPLFSIFGIGEYSFAKYKVGVSGFYKKPIFSLIFSSKPVMLDDTCYFIGFQKFDIAYVAMLILNSSVVQNFLKSIAFVDSKRPYTKKVLERIDFKKITRYLDFIALKKVERQLLNNDYLTKEILKQFIEEVNQYSTT